MCTTFRLPRCARFDKIFCLPPFLDGSRARAGGESNGCRRAATATQTPVPVRTPYSPPQRQQASGRAQQARRRRARRTRRAGAPAACIRGGRSRARGVSRGGTAAGWARGMPARIALVADARRRRAAVPPAAAAVQPPPQRRRRVEPLCGRAVQPRRRRRRRVEPLCGAACLAAACRRPWQAEAALASQQKLPAKQ